MKQFIVLAAVLPIMLVFVAQFSIEAVRGLRMNAAEDAVRAFCIEATYYDGGPAGAEALRSKLAQIFHCDANEVWIELAQTDAAHINWSISFPVGEVMASGSFMGLSKAENNGRAHMGGVIVVAPPPPEPSTDPEQRPPADPTPDSPAEPPTESPAEPSPDSPAEPASP